MSGHNVPYQLRPNKFVERQLFLDVLDFIRVWNGPSRYIYASMGAKFLEDFKLINERFAVAHMISLEMEENTWKRQKFNRLGFIDCRFQTTGEFVESVDRLMLDRPRHRLIVWLDYAVANQRGEQLGEFRQLVSKMASGDVIKITLNANPQSYRRRASQLTRKDFEAYLKDPDSEIFRDFETYMTSLLARKDEHGALVDRNLSLSDAEYEAICIGNLTDQLGEYLPVGNISSDDLESAAFAQLLLGSIKLAALKGVEGTKQQIIPLAAYRYRDGEHQMMTATAIIADENLVAAINQDEVFDEWPFRSLDWSTVNEVSVPDLSPKERHHLDGMMSSESDTSIIHGNMPFWLDAKERVSLSLLEAYLKHYRRYPSFVRVQ